MPTAAKECYTIARGASNREDVWVARTVAERVGVEHVVTDASGDNVAAPAARTIDLKVQTAWTLRVADGMMGVLTPLHGKSAVFRTEYSLWGHGGECLRGGWAERLREPTAGDVAEVFERTWEGYPVFAARAGDRQRELARTWVAARLASSSPADVLDLAYLYFRVGRWVAAGSRGVGSKFLPLLDNRFSREVLAISAEKKRSHYLHRELIARLLPQVADLPLANQFWAGTSQAKRARLRKLHPEAHGEPRTSSKKRQRSLLHQLRRSLAGRVRELTGVKTIDGLAPPVTAHIRDYLIREGRLDALAEVVDLDRTARFLRAPDPALQPKRLFLGLYSAAVLLSENWRVGRITRRPIETAGKRAPAC